MASEQLPEAGDDTAAEDRIAQAAEYNANQLLQISQKLDAVNGNLVRVIKGIEDLASLMSSLGDKR
jgi:hypothetical protein